MQMPPLFTKAVGPLTLDLGLAPEAPERAPQPGADPWLAAGTAIATPNGAMPIEALRPGMMVETLDNGPQPVRAVRAGSKPAPWVTLQAPDGPVQAAPGQPVLMAGWEVELYFATEEALAPAGSLAEETSETIAQGFQLVLDRPEIVYAGGLPVESAGLKAGSAPRPVLDAQEGAVLRNALA